MKRRYLIYTSLFGYYIIGISVVTTLLEKKQYSILMRVCCDGLFLAPIYLFIVFGIFGIEKYFCCVHAVRYALYFFLILIVYFSGVLMLKRLLKYKQEM